ncbi:hypothetical protein V4S33_01880 [Enterococcus cecorum]
MNQSSEQWRLYLQDLDEKNQAYQNLLEEQGTMQEKFQALRSQLPLDLQHLDHVSFIQELAKRDQATQISKNAQQQRQMLNAKLAQLNQNMTQFRKTADFLYEWLPIANLSIAEQLGKIRQFKEEMQAGKNSTCVSSSDSNHGTNQSKTASARRFVKTKSDFIG